MGADLSLRSQYVMSQQSTWWYNTQEFWLQYPHWRMRGGLKIFYLLQLSYWLQQLLVLVLRIEAPRSDFVELCLHVSARKPRELRLVTPVSQKHIVTLWLVGWSYAINLTCTPLAWARSALIDRQPQISRYRRSYFLQHGHCRRFSGLFENAQLPWTAAHIRVYFRVPTMRLGVLPALSKSTYTAFGLVRIRSSSAG